MNKLISAILAIPKTIWFNFRYLPFNHAIKMPILLSHNVRVRSCYRDAIKFKHNYNPTTFGIRIGFHKVEPIDNYSLHTIIDIRKGGILKLLGETHIGIGAIIFVGFDAKLILGKNFAISGTTSIICKKYIEIGNDVQLSYNGLIMDSDSHKIYDINNILLKNTEPIVIGSKVWITPNVTILKGSIIPDNCIIASNSLVNKKFYQNGYIIGGISQQNH